MSTAYSTFLPINGLKIADLIANVINEELIFTSVLAGRSLGAAGACTEAEQTML